jgi:nitrite reductase/ring-hydroxylating ferredoxin subunit
MAVRGLKRSTFQRLLGVCVTAEADPGCWVTAQGTITVNLAGAPELASRGGAVRLEGKGLPRRVLLFRDETGVLRGVENTCVHMGRRIDPVPGEAILQCCSVKAAAYQYDGTKIEGPGEGQVKALEVREKHGTATVRL